MSTQTEKKLPFWEGSDASDHKKYKFIACNVVV